MEICIAIIAFNKVTSFKRLLSSISKVIIPQGATVDLCFCIDGGGNPEIEQLANNFVWHCSKKRVIVQPNNIGLKKNVYETMKLGLEYDALVVLEDDLFVSTQLIKYVENILFYYPNPENIAGYSLYSSAFNETAYCNFTPINDGYDVFFMKVPSSWGQFYTRKQIEEYFDWYEAFGELNITTLPPNVSRWSHKSWKKEFFYYLIKTNKYFIYPRDSLTTNYADAGEHHKGSDIYQVPLAQQVNNLNLVDIANSNAVYDEYCEIEPQCLNRQSTHLNFDGYVIDLYGFKFDSYSLLNKEYLISTMRLGNHVKSWDNSLLPLEMNIINDNQGDGIYLYKICDVNITRIAIIKSRIKLFFKLHHIRVDTSLMSRLLGRN